MAKISYKKRQELIAQALTEIRFARDFKQGKVRNWQKNEDLYYSKKTAPASSRANVDLGQMQSFVHTLLSKIDNPLVFKYTKRKDSQLKRVKRLNALRKIDAEKDNWDIKDIVGKKQAVIYGRAIYSYYADSYKGYCAHLDNVDVYDFLIDPSAGGIDIERANFMGNYGLVKTTAELKQGIKDGIYLKTETENLIDGSGNATEEPQEQVNKLNRTVDQNVWNAQKEINNPDKYKFWHWYTTDLSTGIRYHLVLNERGSQAIVVEELTEILESNLWPFWTWAAFPDLTEFWTPSFCDYVREIFMAQAVSINQMLDNAEQVNKPQKVVNVGAVEDLASLKYRRDGYIKVKGEFDLDKAVNTIKVPSITTPIEVFKLLEIIQQKSSGVTDGDAGLADPNGKATIYEGNQANSGDKYGYLNKSYAFGYKRFATLYEAGVNEHLLKKIAVDILGPNGVEVEEITRRDIFRKNDTFGVMVEASNAELAQSETDKKFKMDFLTLNAANPMQNPQKAYEISATIAGFEDEEIRQLMDTSEFGNADLMSEAERDIEYILDGKIVQPNQNANVAYKQRFVDYMRDHEEDIDMDTFKLLADYVLKLEPIIMRNMVRQANEMALKAMLAQPAEGGAAPAVDTTKTEVINNDNIETPTI